MTGEEAHHDNNKGGNGMPQLGKYLPRLQQKFVGYVRDMLAREFSFLAEEPERLEAIVSEVEEAMYEESGPNMGVVLDMAEELGMTEEQGARVMTDLKSYMNDLMREIMKEAGMPNEEVERTARSLGYALEGLDARDYLYMIADMFSGKADMEAIGDFVNTNFEMPDLSDIKQYIFDEMTNGFRNGMKDAKKEDGTPVFDDATIENVVERIGDEMRKEYGPDFYALPALFEELGMDEDLQRGAIKSIQDLLEASLTKAVRRVNGLP